MQISLQQASILLFLITLVFLLAPAFLALYIKNYNNKKREHHHEKGRMKKEFEDEIHKVGLEVKEHTMKTIGADLHDNIGQLLGLTNLTLSTINLNDREKAAEKIADSIGLTKKSIKELRQLAHLMNGSSFMSSSLADAIGSEVDWLERTGRFKIQLNVQSQTSGRSPDKDIIVFRVFQEILNNVMKHAEATEITIDLFVGSPELQLQVKDNGKGFSYNAEAMVSGIGLANLKKRAELIGGTLMIDSVINNGTNVAVNVPYP